MNRFQIIALTSPGLPDPSIAIAASRAGGLGVLDLEYFYGEKVAHETFRKLAQFAKNEFGIKLDARRIALLDKLTPTPLKHFKTVILANPDIRGMKKKIQTLERKGLGVLLECTSLEQAAAAEKIGVKGIIAKGNEAGGRVGNETTFILLQQFMRHLSLPVWAQGGIGLHTAAACYAAGAAGIVVDAQLALTRESVLADDIKSKIAGMDGTETQLLGEEIGEIYRVCSRLSLPVVNELKQKERTLLKAGNSKANTVAKWKQTICQHIGSDASEHPLFFFGQDIAFAAFLADRFVTVGGIIQAFRQAAESHIRAAQLHQPLTKGSPLAQSHGTRYPIVQGPMARVSDTPAFALEVARRGALPFMAAAWMRRQKLDALLKETRTLLKDWSWGVGLLGFLPSDVYQEQFETVITHRPAFALIAGGQPAQAKALEHEGITTYVHVPSPNLLRMFLDNGLRHFVFEGRESGGHVGPLCGFALWEVMIEELLRFLENSMQPEEYHVLFAGGIHDALSASMVALMAAPLAERGVRVGFQLGSAYLFAQEAVDTGAIVHSYQQELHQCDHTILLETGIGHANRCIETPFTASFIEEKRRLSAEGKSANEIQNKLESLSRGRLRIASKGIMRNPENVQNPGTPQLISISKEEQRQKGMYLIGQLAVIKDRPLTINELHHDIAVEGSKRIEALLKEHSPYLLANEESRPLDIAIIGMACLLPKAPTLQQYWENILNKIDAVREIPKERWDWRLYYDPNRNTKDKINSKWGAFLDDIHFDPTRYGLPPSTLSAIEPLQLLTLEVVRWALEDSGYTQRPFPRERTSVILGISGSGELGQQYSFRTSLPTFFGDGSHEIVSRFDQILPNWTEDSFPGILMNVAAGRVANRFNLGGVNCSVDGACASSLTAVYMATQELEANTSDMVIVGGADCMQNPFTYMCFSKTHALSPRGQCNALDENADGIVLGEGIAVMILKRLADAERDGDHIYGLIKGIGASSDGRDKSLTAPGQKGQVRALERAYAKANISPAAVELIEAHATGTTVGDRVEVEALSHVFKDSGAEQHVCAIGSIKSMIGHTKSAAGLASLMKATLALHHKVLPPTNGVDTPNPILLLPDTPFYVNTEARPWIHHKKDHPRSAGVSAFGFGGTNFHVVLEEYRNDYLEHLKQVSFQQWPGELLIWSGNSREELLQTLITVQDAFAKGAKPSLASLAYAYARLNAENLSETKGNQLRLAFVANSLEDFTLKLNQAKETLISSKTEIWDPRGVYFAEQPQVSEVKVAFLFPGQGSQYIDMLADLAIQFPQIRECFERSDQVLDDKLSKPLSHFIFPTPAFSKKERHSKESALADTQIAQPAMGTADLAMFHLLLSFGIKPEIVAGHSYGEYVALCAAGVLSEDDLIALSEARARFMVESAGSDPGSMAAIKADANTVAENIKDLEGVWIANVNAPQQIVISGNRLAVEKAVNKFKGLSIQARPIPVSCAFHSPVMSKASERLKDFLSRIKLHRPRLKVFSNTAAGPYPANHAEVVRRLVNHLTSGVEFVREIEAMYEEGARIFVEVGPGRVLSNLVNQILNDRPHLAVISNQAGRSGLVQLQHLLGQLAVHGVAIKLDRLYEGRSLKDADLKALLKVSKDKNPSPTTWLVNGARAKPYAAANGSGPEKIHIAQQITARTNTIEQPSAASSGEQNSTPEAARRPWTDIRKTPAKTGSSEASLYTSSPLSGDGTSHVMLQYQQLMQRFLETQKGVMLTYLQGATDHAEADTFEANQALQNLQTPSVSPTQQISAQKISSEQAQIKTHLNAEPPAQDVAGSPTAGEASMDREGLILQLLAIVSERTGYPQEMLDLDLDLEADLGIDSIKRMEIFGIFLQNIASSQRQEIEGKIDELTKLKTLRLITEWLQEHTVSDTTDGAKEYESSGANVLEHSEKNTLGDPSVHRFTLVTECLPAADPPSSLADNGVIFITDDERGIASNLADELKARGHRVALIQLGSKTEEVESGCYRSALNSPEDTGELLEIIRQRQGVIGGLIHLLPLKEWIPWEAIDLSHWKERIELEVKSLFFLIKNLEEDLTKAAQNGGACIIGATGMGGRFASDSSPPSQKFFPGHGAIAGLLKTAAIEWPHVKVRVVDLKIEDDATNLSRHLLAEMSSDDHVVEVGYDGSQRLYLKPTLSPLNQNRPNATNLDSSSVILVTGGARGITAEVARELAQRYRPTLILIGRSPLPAEQEAHETARLVCAQELKSALIAERQRRSQPVNLQEVEADYRHLLKEREIRENIAAMRAAGAKVNYFQVDVRDENRFGGLIDEIYKNYGRLDGVIHGAGIIEDKLLKDKTWESFARVLGTKTESAFILSRKLRPDFLKFLVFFTSVAGRFGNQGQGDYAAANEVLNKLAIYLDTIWPGRVVSINWGPWAKAGMVSPELQRQFIKRGIELVPPDIGVKSLDHEISHGDKGKVEVIIGGVDGWVES